MKTKIALLIDVLENIRGGAERQAYELVRGLNKELFEVDLYVLHGTTIPDEIKPHCHIAQGLNIKRIYDLKGIASGLRFAKELRKNKTDLLMTYHFASDIWGAYWGKKTNAQIISSRRDEGFWKKWFHVLAYRLTNRYVDKVCVVSEAVQSKMILEKRIPPEKVLLLHNGVDLNRFKTKIEPLQLKRGLELSAEATIIGCVGNLAPIKGHKFLIEATKKILISFPNTHFIFVGEDKFETKGTLEQEIQRHNLSSNIHLLGKRTDIPQLLQIMDICVLPSLSEGLSNALLEYMAIGKPIVATRVGGNPELIQHKVNGLLVEPSNAKDLAEKVIYLLRNTGEGTRLGKKAKEDVEANFSIKRMIERYENLFVESVEPTAAVILGLSANGLSIARSLGRKGIPVIGLETNTQEPGTYSRFLKKMQVIPDPINKEDEFILALSSLGKRLGKKSVLFTTADGYIAAVSKHREELKKYFYLILPTHELVEGLLDKKSTAHLAQKYNITHPRTYVIHNLQELRKIASSIDFPCIIKPRLSHLWKLQYDAQKVVIAKDASELIDAFSKIQDKALEVVLQEIVPGPDANIYEFMAYCNRNAKPEAYFCCRKIRQYPPHFGVGCFAESINAPSVIALGLSLLEQIHYQGLVHLEIKIDSHTQQPALLEANLRTSFIGELSVASGIDLPYIAYCDQINFQSGHKKTVANFTPGVKLVNLELDLGSFFRLWKNGELGVFAWISSYMAKKWAFVYFAADDLKPFWFVYTRFMKMILKKALKLGDSPLRGQFPIKIAHIVSSNGIFGAEKVMLNLASQINYNGSKSCIIAIENTHNPHNEVTETAKTWCIPTFNLESRGKIDLRAISRLTNYIKTNNITLLHTHNYKANFIGLFAARKAKIPIVATVHGYMYIGNSKKLGFYEALDRFILRYFNKVILVEGSLEKWFKKSKVKYEIINNGINIEESLEHSDTKSADQQIVIGTISRLKAEKGHKYLLEAFARVVKDYGNIQLLIVGEGELGKELEDLALALGIKDKVTFTGYQSDTAKYYRAMNIYVCSSLAENLSISILEAMNFGKAIIATNIGGTPELIKDGNTGILINSKSAEEIYLALLRCIHDPKLRKSLGENARQYAKENYSLEKMVNSYRNIYEVVR